MQNSALNIGADNAVIKNNNITFVGMVQGHQNKGKMGGEGEGRAGSKKMHS